NLFVANDISCNGNIYVGKDITIIGRLNVQNYTNQNIINTTTTNYQLIVSEDISLNGRLCVSSDTSLNRNLFVANDTSLNSRLFVGSDIIANKQLFAVGDASLNGNVYIRGNIGIGITNPTVPLHITSTATYSSQSGISVYSAGGIITGTSVYVSSDNRIKNNIVDATDLSCIYMLRDLKPKLFNFTDTKKKGMKPVWGFIAQEVKEVIPNAITYTKDYITNIYEPAELHDNIITLTNTTTTKLVKSEQGYYKLKLFNTDEEEYIVSIKEIIDEKRFIVVFEKPIETHNHVIFVYGQEVPDFHSLDKDMIFTLTTAAVKEIDTQHQASKQEIIELKNEIQILKEQIKLILSRLPTM
ncbi:MAG: tail fiber domain-containing protein, partial [Alphaproteobacteria bacterium]|nr:tail fiber domain-containing protein [Alphaproteobacteria bacterium]